MLNMSSANPMDSAMGGGSGMPGTGMEGMTGSMGAGGNMVVRQPWPGLAMSRCLGH